MQNKLFTKVSQLWQKIKRFFDLFDSLVSLQNFITFCLPIFYFVKDTIRRKKGDFVLDSVLNVVLFFLLLRFVIFLLNKGFESLCEKLKKEQEKGFESLKSDINYFFEQKNLIENNICLTTCEFRQIPLNNNANRIDMAIFATIHNSSNKLVATKVNLRETKTNITSCQESGIKIINRLDEQGCSVIYVAPLSTNSIKVSHFSLERKDYSFNSVILKFDISIEILYGPRDDREKYCFKDKIDGNYIFLFEENKFITSQPYPKEIIVQRIF